MNRILALALVLSAATAAPASAAVTRCGRATGANARQAVHGRAGRGRAVCVGRLVVFTRQATPSSRAAVAFAVHRGRRWVPAGADRLPGAPAAPLRVTAARRALHVTVALPGCRRWALTARYRSRAGRWRRTRLTSYRPTCAAPRHPTPIPTPTPTCPVARPQTTWRPPGSRPLTDAQAAACVTRSPENRPGNATANAYVPAPAQLSAFRSALDIYGRTPVEYSPDNAYVTGRAAAYGIRSTDDILEWAAYKWGIPEDFERAQAVMESWWSQGQLGDRVDGVDASAYPAVARIDADSAYESLGILQLRWRPSQPWHQGIEPLRWQSTAFNADYSAAVVRYYYDGYCDWCGAGYRAGDVDGAYRAYYSGTWSDGQWYADGVRRDAAVMPWRQPGF